MNIANYMADTSLIDMIAQNTQIFGIVALAVIAFTILFIGLFKGFKPAFILTIVLICLAAAGLGAAFVTMLIIDGLDDPLKLVADCVPAIISWLPTILFFLIIIISTLTGARRGFRKSMILAVHAICAGAVCITLYVLLTTSAVVDAWLLSVINFFAGGDGALQNSMGVSSEITELKDVLACWLLTVIPDANIGIMLQDSYAYVITIVNLIYSIVFAIILFILYLILKFLLYIIYLIFYSERKYKKKKNNDFVYDRTDATYRPHRLGGGIVGFLRGCLTAVISISFIGSAFFMIAGGTGEGRLPEHEFGDGYVDTGYTIYRSVESYGAQGIFRILNSIKDPNDTPYYLFAADLVFSGGLSDDEHDINGNIIFREEIGAYTGFALDTMSLLLKYGGDSLLPVLDGGEQSEDTMQTIIDVMTLPEFQLEFENLFDNFDAQTYFINLSLSLVDSIISNIDDISFTSSLSAESRELLKVMFKKGYLSDSIPDERELKAKVQSGKVTGYAYPPTISVNQLFTKKDAKLVLSLVLSTLAEGIDFENNSTGEMLMLIKSMLAQLEELSIFSTSRKDEMNPVFARMYCLIENTYLTEEGEDGIRYEDISSENVYWGGELKTLISVADDILTLYDNIDDGSGDVLHMLLSVFDKEEANYLTNIALYDNICNGIADSVLIGKVFASGFVMGNIRTQLSSISSNIYVPDKVVFENKYDSDGNLVSYGEAYQFFYGLRLIGENKQLTDMLLDSSAAADIKDMLNIISDTILNKDSQGNTLTDYLTESVLLRSVITSVITEEGKGVLAVPRISLETNSDYETVNLIKKEELKQILDCLPSLIDIVLPLTEGEVTTDDINDLINNEVINELLDSGNGIIEGTVSNMLIEQFKGDSTVIIPARLEDFENWVSYGTPGELRKILAAVRTLASDFWDILDGETDGLFDALNNLDSEDIQTILDSDVLHYTVSQFLQGSSASLGDFTIIIPASSKLELKNDTIDSLITKNEIIVLFEEIQGFDLDGDMSATDMMAKLVSRREKLTESKIISASFVNFIVQDNSISSALSIPEELLAAGTRQQLENYSSTNLWYGELNSLLTALDEIFEISAGGEFDSSDDALLNRMSDLLRSMNKPSTVADGTKLEVCYSSLIVRNTLTKELDDALDGVVESNVLDGAKQGGYYKISEIQSLSDAADIFGLDFLELDNTELTGKVKDVLMDLNEPRADYEGRTTLEVIYPSVIISHIMTTELDKVIADQLVSGSLLDSFKNSNSVYEKEEMAALVDGINALGITGIDEVEHFEFSNISKIKSQLDSIYLSSILKAVIAKQLDDNLTSNIIDADVLVKIKTDYFYPREEVEAMFDAFEELNLNSVDDLSGFDFGEISSFNRQSSISPADTRLDVIYRSDIVGGVMTHAVRDGINGNSLLADNENAYRQEIAIYNKVEIQSLIDLLGGSGVEDYSMGAASELKEYILPDTDGKPRSYIIWATLSKNLLENEELTIPSRIVSRSLIDLNELVLLIDVFTAINGNDSLDGWNASGNMVLPSKDNRQPVVDSLIMRATMTDHILQLNNQLTVAVNNVEIETDYNGNRIAILCSGQMLAFFDILDICSDGDELNVPSFGNLESISAHSDYLEVLYEFDTVRYSISSVIINTAKDMPFVSVETEDEEVCVLSYGKNVTTNNATVSVVPVEYVRYILAMFDY